MGHGFKKYIFNDEQKGLNFFKEQFLTIIYMIGGVYLC